MRSGKVDAAPGLLRSARAALIYLFQSGGRVTSTSGTLAHWDRLHGQPIPPSILGTQRVTGMTAGQSQFLTNRPIRPFRTTVTAAGG